MQYSVQYTARSYIHSHSYPGEGQNQWFVWFVPKAADYEDTSKEIICLWDAVWCCCSLLRWMNQPLNTSLSLFPFYKLKNNTIIMVLYGDTPMCLRTQQKKKEGSQHSVFFFPAIIIYPSTFTPAINRKGGDGVVARCDIQQKMSDFTVYFQSSSEFLLKEISKNNKKRWFLGLYLWGKLIM